MDNLLKPGISLSREAEPVENESPLKEEEEDEEAEEEETEEEDEERWGEDTEEEEWENEEDEKMPFISEEGESAVNLSEGGSGGYEGSADASVRFGDIGSGDSWTEEGKENKKNTSPLISLEFETFNVN